MSDRAPRMSWRRVVNVSLVLAVIAAAAMLAPVAWQNQQSMSEQVRAIPRPRPANDAQQVAIVRAVVVDYWFDGVNPGSVEPSGPRLPVLLDRTYSIAHCGAVEVYPPLECASPVGTGDTKLHPVLTDIPEFREFPLKLRREMVAANRTESVMPDPRIPGLRRMEKDRVLAHFGAGAVSGWRGFQSDFPEAFGILHVSRSVLSEDGSEALLYVDYSCGDLCGMGMLYLLRRNGDDWIVAAKTGLWVS